jgi:8-oxo-dGTP pyrophosphatase MutT (NUDIX family)
MHRRPLLVLLEDALARQPENRERIARTHRFVAAHPDCLLRSCVPGHVTGSAWIVSHDHARVLLTHHRKLGRWLQLGGHADGDPDLFAVALREAREESGLERFATLPGDAGRLPLDVDVHEIPAREAEPAHLHYDVRFLLLAEAAQELRLSDESHALRWVPWEELSGLVTEESLHRMARRARALLDLPPA